MTYVEKDVGLNGAVPMQSVRSDSPEVTEALRRLFYLEEIERQAELFNDSFSDAMTHALIGEVMKTFRHLQGALFAAIIVDRMTQQRGTSSRARPRVDDVRTLLAMTEQTLQPWSQLLKTKGIRNAFEHIDERIDQALSSDDVYSISDWHLPTGFYLRAGGTKWAALRAFDPLTGQLFFGDDSINMLSLDLDMIRVRHNAREAQAQELARVHGRLEFGGAEVYQRDADAHAMVWVNRWRSDRAKLLESLAPAIDLDGRIRLFAGAPANS